MSDFITQNKVASIFNISKETLDENAELGKVPAAFRKITVGALYQKGYKASDLPHIGSELGFLKKPKQSKAICVFTTKGGVLKSTLSLNIARMAALHGQKVCVLGLDIQGDITSALGFESEFDSRVEEQGASLSEVLLQIDSTKGLYDLFTSQVRLEKLLQPTDLEFLYLIPETPELAALSDGLTNINRREYWLKEKVIEPLKQYFDLIVMDCSPNWNKLTTNALVATDLLVSPLECKINNFRNFKVFQQFLIQFKKEMKIDLETLFVPTKYAKGKKLSMDIMKWYRDNVESCSDFGIRESVLGEESVALNKSLSEHAPSKELSQEMAGVLREVFEKLNNPKNALLTPSTALDNHRFKDNSYGNSNFSHL